MHTGANGQAQGRRGWRLRVLRRALCGSRASADGGDSLRPGGGVQWRPVPAASALPPCCRPRRWIWRTTTWRCSVRMPHWWTRIPSARWCLMLTSPLSMINQVKFEDEPDLKAFITVDEPESHVQLKLLLLTGLLLRHLLGNLTPVNLKLGDVIKISFGWKKNLKKRTQLWLFQYVYIFFFFLTE